MRNFRESQRHSDFALLLDGKRWNDYTWGQVIEVFKIGNYGIVKYISSSEKEDVNKVRFHPFIWTNEYPEYHDNQYYWSDTNTSYYSLDSALVGVIARKYDGLNSQAGAYFCKMIGLE